MPKGSNVPVPTTALRVELGWRSGPGVPDADASALLLVGRKGPFRRRLRLLQPARALLRRGPARGQAGRGRPGDRHAARRPRARGARRSRPWSSPPPRTAAPSGRCPDLYIRVLGRARGHGGRPLRQRRAPPSRPRSCSASSTAARAPGSSAPSARATAAAWRAWPPTSASPSTNRQHGGTAPAPVRRRPRPVAPPRHCRPPPCPPPAAPPRRPARAAAAPVRLDQGDAHQGGPVGLADQAGRHLRRPAREPQLAGAQAVLGVGQQAGPGRRHARRPRPRPVRPVRTLRRQQGRRPGPRQRLRRAAPAAVHPPRRRRPHRRRVAAARTSPSTSTTSRTSGASSSSSPSTRAPAPSPTCTPRSPSSRSTAPRSTSPSTSAPSPPRSARSP